jgi:hypothetical protein
MNNWPTLSLAMITKDAERSLAAALASARPFVDEIIVVDTGSQDGTREIARDFGARLVDFTWCDDFSAARNYSLQHATGNWIFWMDADDELPDASGRELRARIDATPSRDAAFFALVEEEVQGKSGQRRVMAHAHVKLFPRHEQIRFRYRIHEQVAPAIRDLGLPIHSTKLVVRHAHADRTPQAELARSQRNLRLALLDLAEHPGDPFVWLSVGSSYLPLNDGAAKAVEYLRRSIAAFPRGSSIQLNAYQYLAQAYAAAGGHEQQRAALDEALQLFPSDLGILMRLGAWHESHGQPSAAIPYYEAALARGRQRASAAHVRDGRSELALRLGRLYVIAGQPDKAQRLWIQFLTIHPGSSAVRQALLALQAHSASTFA